MPKSHKTPADLGLEMVPATLEFVQELLESPGLDPAMRGPAEGTLAHYGRVGFEPPWHGYFARNRTTGAWTGVCAFVKAPENGEVEISYFTMPELEGRGLATALAGFLVEKAFAAAEVKAVIAHTMPEENASTSILKKHAFVRDSIYMDDDIGEAWRWIRRRPL